jgi:hypothetical protein
MDLRTHLILIFEFIHLPCPIYYAMINKHIMSIGHVQNYARQCVRIRHLAWTSQNLTLNRILMKNSSFLSLPRSFKPRRSKSFNRKFSKIDIATLSKYIELV